MSGITTSGLGSLNYLRLSRGRKLSGIRLNRGVSAVISQKWNLCQTHSYQMALSPQSGFKLNWSFCRLTGSTSHNLKWVTLKIANFRSKTTTFFCKFSFSLWSRTFWLNSTIFSLWIARCQTVSASSYKNIEILHIFAARVKIRLRVTVMGFTSPFVLTYLNLTASSLVTVRRHFL